MYKLEEIPQSAIVLKNKILKALKDNFSTKDFIFEEVEHKYTLEGKVLTSATTFIKKFYKEYDTVNEAIKYALKHGLIYEEVLKEWEAKGLYARILGTNVHKWIEDFWNGLNPAIPDHPDEAIRVNAYLEFHYKHFKRFIQIAQEVRVFSRKYGISGTIDALFLVEIEDGIWVLQIWDWKTNKDGKFTTDSDFNFGKYLLHPFKNLKENEHNKYSLQMALYKILLNDVGIEVDNCYLCHIPPSGNIKVHMAKDLSVILKKYLNNELTDITKTIPTDLF